MVDGGMFQGSFQPLNPTCDATPGCTHTHTHIRTYAKTYTSRVCPVHGAHWSPVAALFSLLLLLLFFFFFSSILSFALSTPLSIHSVQAAIETGAIHNATWVPPNQYGRVCPDPMGEVRTLTPLLDRSRSKSWQSIKLSPVSSTAAPCTRRHRSHPGRARCQHQAGHKRPRGCAKYDTLASPQSTEYRSQRVASLAYGHWRPQPCVPVPAAVALALFQVGQHITGRRASVTQLAEDGKMTNASWVPPNRFGRTIPDPKKEVGRFIEDRATNVPRQLASGEVSDLLLIFFWGRLQCISE